MCWEIQINKLAIPVRLKLVVNSYIMLHHNNLSQACNGRRNAADDCQADREAIKLHLAAIKLYSKMVNKLLMINKTFLCTSLQAF